jgi:hypothetical protein
MICLIPAKKMYKKRKSLISYRDFVIVNSTHDSRIKDLPNVFSDIVSGDDGLRSTFGLDALAFQINSNVFGENISERMKNSLITGFFTSADFTSELVNVCAYQIKHPNTNVYICIEDKAYDMLIDQYLERMEELIDADPSIGRIIYSWNTAKDMRSHTLTQVHKQIDGFDKEEWERNSEYNSFIVDDLEDDDYDRYLDAVNIRDILEHPESNKQIRELFFRYANYTDKQLKALGRFVKIAAERIS